MIAKCRQSTGGLQPWQHLVAGLCTHRNAVDGLHVVKRDGLQRRSLVHGAVLAAPAVVGSVGKFVLAVGDPRGILFVGERAGGFRRSLGRSLSRRGLFGGLCAAAGGQSEDHRDNQQSS